MQIVSAIQILLECRVGISPDAEEMYLAPIFLHHCPLARDVSRNSA